MLVRAPLLDVEQELGLRGDGGAAGELAAPGPGLGLELDVGLLVPGLEAHRLGLAPRAAAAAAHRPGLLPLCTVLLQLGLDTHAFYIHFHTSSLKSTEEDNSYIISTNT